MSQTVKPITLTILPNNTTVQSVTSQGAFILSTPSPIYNTTNTVSEIPIINKHQTGQSYNPHIPQFNHVPIQPIVVNKLDEMSADDFREKERRRLESERLRSARYRQKTADYQKIGTLKTEKEKFMALAILCYPELRNMESWRLDQKISEFIISLNS